MLTNKVCCHQLSFILFGKYKQEGLKQLEMMMSVKQWMQVAFIPTNSTPLNILLHIFGKFKRFGCCILPSSGFIQKYLHD